MYNSCLAESLGLSQVDWFAAATEGRSNGLRQEDDGKYAQKQVAERSSSRLGSFKTGQRVLRRDANRSQSRDDVVCVSGRMRLGVAC
jgi:hypothetical protein